MTTIGRSLLLLGLFDTLQHLLNVRLQRKGRRRAIVAFDRKAVPRTLDDEFCEKVPPDVGTIRAFQSFVDRVRVFAIDIDLLHHREVGAPIAGELLDVVGIAWLLVAKLVAREGENLERLILQLLLQLSQLLVVSLSQASFGCHIGDHDHPILEAREVEGLPVQVVGFEREEFRGLQPPAVGGAAEDELSNVFHSSHAVTDAFSTGNSHDGKM
mmetsp:Transcript_5791/g.8196  ORF Transcript_5791/g.8196 Transcript_5791/m.8196 type:complete len:213 (-) Transcript_5791:55-693(-)|eukprot:CAMPEP_0206452590 /NCGR_PEP_ID=MMETSP0324_2-20121206/20038_1 /ASSEMBLY_ACC=CAM_ASM_000836 /TAXON_ID=2866 /ORGANISM="Crypthecodinium cohnii, Strain Seligo" /LENGTH=212 /DNA_ID=CAMNT_0053922713 /DNA_START=414 /DNA_END=1052 /DNA_ORIENTATION=+